MCMDCWRDTWGAPTIDNDRVRAAAQAIEELYDSVSTVGAPMHCELDDWNLPLDRPVKKTFDVPFYAELKMEQKKTAVIVYKRMRRLSYLEQASALALAQRFWR